MLGGNVVFTGTNGNAPGTYFYTLALTNPALPITNWSILSTNQFGSGGGFVFTYPFDSSEAQKFLFSLSHDNKLSKLKTPL